MGFNQAEEGVGFSATGVGLRWLKLFLEILSQDGWLRESRLFEPVTRGWLISQTGPEKVFWGPVNTAQAPEKLCIPPER